MLKNIVTKPKSNHNFDDEKYVATKGQSNEDIKNAITPVTPESPGRKSGAPSPMPEHVIIALGESNESQSVRGSLKDQLDKEI